MRKTKGIRGNNGISLLETLTRNFLSPKLNCPRGKIAEGAETLIKQKLISVPNKNLLDFLPTMEEVLPRACQRETGEEGTGCWRAAPCWPSPGLLACAPAKGQGWRVNTGAQRQELQQSGTFS